MGFFKIDIQGAIVGAATDALTKVGKTLDLDGDGQADLEKQLMPMVHKFSSGAQTLTDSINYPALAANAMIMGSDIQKVVLDGRALLKTVDMTKAQKGFADVQSSTQEFITYVTKSVANQQHHSS